MGKTRTRWVACLRCGAFLALEPGRCLRCGASYEWPSQSGRFASRWSLSGLMLIMVPIAAVLAAFRVHENVGAFALVLVLLALVRTIIVLEQQSRRTGPTTPADAAVVFLGSLTFMVVVLVGVIPSLFAVIVAVRSVRMIAEGGPEEVLSACILIGSIAWLVLASWVLRIFLRYRRARALERPLLRGTRTRYLLTELPDADQPAREVAPSPVAASSDDEPGVPGEKRGHSTFLPS